MNEYNKDSKNQNNITPASKILKLSLKQNWHNIWHVIEMSKKLYIILNSVFVCIGVYSNKI